MRGPAPFLATLALLAAVATGARAETASIVQAGVAAAVRGQVERVSLAPAPTVGRIVESGDPIYLGDEIRTGPSAGLQVLLMDETVFTIGPDSGLVIDTFVYDPETDSGEVAARIVSGVFRFVSGRIARREPSDMTVHLPVGVIGIRGTAVAGRLVGNLATVVLLGPGEDNNAGERPGRIVVGNGNGSVEVTRPGFGVEMGASTPPTTPVRMPASVIAGLAADLSPPPPTTDPAAGTDESGGSTTDPEGADQPIDEGAPVTEQAGQTVASALEPSLTTTTVEAVAQQLSDESFDSAQDAASTFTNVTTFEQLRGIPSGTATYSDSNIALVATSGVGNGAYNLTATIDFGVRDIQLDLSGNYSLGGAAGLDVTPTTGFQVFDYSGKTGDASGGPDPFTTKGGHTGTLKLRFRNDVNSGEFARFMDHKLSITDGVGNTIETTGGETTATRQ